MVTASGPLDGVAREDLPQALRSVGTPTTLTLAPLSPTTMGDDHITAINVGRRLCKPHAPEVDRAIHGATTKYRGAAAVRLEHFIGGPCDDGSISCCVVPGGSGRGWTIVKKLQSAIELAHSRAVRRHEAQGEVGGGQTVILHGLKARPELNGELGVALRFAESNGRWQVRLRNGDGKELKPTNLQGSDGNTGRVLVFWGDAQWSRTQLLGEIARGHWGLCKASIAEIAALAEERWNRLLPRLAFAPVTEMTEDFLRKAQKEMETYRVAGMVPAGEVEDDDRGTAV